MGKSKVVFGDEVIIDLTSDTVTADKMLKGYTAHGADGEKITGTCEFDVDSSAATATQAEVLSGKTFAKGGQVLTGTMKNKFRFVVHIQFHMILVQGDSDEVFRSARVGQRRA